MDVLLHSTGYYSVWSSKLFFCGSRMLFFKFTFRSQILTGPKSPNMERFICIFYMAFHKRSLVDKQNTLKSRSVIFCQTLNSFALDQTLGIYLNRIFPFSRLWDWTASNSSIPASSGSEIAVSYLLNCWLQHPKSWFGFLRENWFLDLRSTLRSDLSTDFVSSLALRCSWVSFILDLHNILRYIHLQKYWHLFHSFRDIIRTWIRKGTSYKAESGTVCYETRCRSPN